MIYLISEYLSSSDLSASPAAARLYRVANLNSNYLSPRDTIARQQWELVNDKMFYCILFVECHYLDSNTGFPYKLNSNFIFQYPLLNHFCRSSKSSIFCIYNNWLNDLICQMWMMFSKTQYCFFKLFSCIFYPLTWSLFFSFNLNKENFIIVM